jgi:hypothetical protein
MPIWGWVCLGAPLVPIALVVWAIVNSRLQEKRTLERGKRLLGWIVQANSDLYDAGSVDAPAQILVSFDAKSDPPDDFMEQLAERVAALKGKEPETGVEAEVAALVNDERYRPYQRSLLPARFTGGKEVYSLHVRVRREYLPAGKIKHSYVRCCVIDDEEKSRPLMLPYEPKDKEFRRRGDGLGV